ncbi:sensor histidine kinase [Paenibacillaceae bacterium WGS1546]|uniref:sensor histidine kinase n=1 Tax=Cohnella sp. WGS1546 TaxID=3366810 RepID=UPI00372D5195
MIRLAERFLNLKFRYKLLLSYLVVVLVPMIVFGQYAYDRSVYYLKEQANARLVESVNKMSQTMVDKSKQANVILDYIAYSTMIQQIISNNYADLIRLQEDYRGKLEPTFTNVLSLNPDVTALTIYTASALPEFGKLLLSRDRVANERWYREAAALTGWFHEGGKLIAVRKVIELTGNRELGVLYMALDYDAFFRDAFRSSLAQYGVALYDREGRPLYRSDILPENKPALPDDLLLSAEREGTVRFDDTEYWLLRSVIPETDWTLAFYSPTKQTTIQANEIIKAMVTLIVVSLLVVFVIIWLFSSTFVRRIRLLNNKMKRVGNGNLDVEITSTSKDEIGDLTNAFGMMVRKINELIDEVYKGELRQKDAELRALQAQINPHFLYNTLSAMKWKAIEIDATELGGIISSLSTFFRTSLNRGRRLISVKEELANTRAYVDIQLIMHDHCFTVQYDVDPEAEVYETAHLVLQPIVENAILHGIDSLPEGEGRLRISVRSVGDDRLAFQVEDNGCGMSEVQVAALWTRDSKGYGLRNVQDRIRMQFGSEYGLSVESRLNRGTTVSLVIPKYVGGG